MKTDVTLGQVEQFVGFVRKEDDPKQFAQNLLSNWGAVKAIGLGLIDQATFQVAVKDLVNPYADEKVQPRWDYPGGWKPATLDEQGKILLRFYSVVDYDYSHIDEYAARVEWTNDTDGLFIIPKVSSIAAKLGIEDPFNTGYGQLLSTTILVHLADQRKFYNYRAGELREGLVQMRLSAINALKALEEKQPEGDFLVIAAQTGLKWGGFSPRNSRWEIEHKTEKEFPLPAWVVGNILLTNPARLDRYEVLWIDCPGDEFRFKPDEEFDNCLFFDFYDGQLKFDNRWIGNVYGNFGSASGFLR